MLFCYNEKIESAKQILKGWENASKELREEVRIIYDEKHAIQKLVYEFKGFKMNSIRVG